MRGRKPELQAIEGGLSRTPPAPTWLPTEAKAAWRRLLPGLIARRVMTKEDLPVFEQYVLCLGIIERSERQIAAEGVTGEDGRRHPAHQSLFQAMTEGRRLAAELGLTPASRKKAVAAGEGEEDPFDL